ASLSSGLATVSSGGKVYQTALTSGGTMSVLSGGSAEKTVVFSGGSFVVFGGTATSATVASGGLMIVYTSSYVNPGLIEAGGSAYVYSGADISGFTVSGTMDLLGRASSATVGQGGVMNVYLGGTAYDTTVSGGGMIVYSGGEANSNTVNSGGTVTVFGTADSTTVSSGGTVTVFGTATGNMVSSGGRMFVSSGGIASTTLVNSGGSVMAIEGGRVITAVVSGKMTVSSGGSADDILVHSGGYLTAMTGGTVTNAALNGGGAVLEGAAASGVTLYGTLEVGGTVQALDAYGTVYLYAGGKVSGGTVGSGAVMNIESGGSMSRLTVLDGGKLTGQFSCTGITFSSGSIVDFNVSQLYEPLDTVLVKNLAMAIGAASFTLTVNDYMMDGTYLLASGAGVFDDVISVVDDYGFEYGSLSFSQNAYVGDKEFSLSLYDGTLAVTVGGMSPGPGPEPPGPGPEPEPEYVTVGYFPGRYMGGTYAYLARETMEASGGDDLINFYVTGASMQDLPVDPGWTVMGAGDFNADGRDDLLRVNYEGYVVGDMTQENGMFVPQVLNFKNEGWEILGIGDFNGNGSDDVLIANPTGASDTVGLLGYWESGVTWTLINGYSAEWECVSTGDFNGDGKCDMLWRNSFVGDDSIVYNAYCTWIVEDPVDWRMVSVANPREWNFLCSGDFDGNGSHDIAMINIEGVVGIWGIGDGYLNSWSILSAVDRSSWTLAGVGDFNGDGTDDIAWASDSLGVVGYWQINNKELTTWANIATIS
ncbi:MAG: hypothetical protein J6Y92_06945, partial [Lentisphaeria bacterium]|nr:hypothetical protein [Lentisphaeria bacterium]